MKICRPGFPMIDTDAPKLQGIRPEKTIIDDPLNREEDNAPRNEQGLRIDGPTLEEYTAAGYAPENYPPSGYAERPSAALEAFKLAQAKPTPPATEMSPADGEPK